MGNRSSSRVKAKDLITVKSNDQLLSELSSLVESLGASFLRGKDPNIYNVVVACMSIVEAYSQTSASLSSQDKLNFCLKLVPLMLNYLVSQNQITPEKSDEFSSFLQNNQTLITSFISVAIGIAKNPSLIQAMESIKIKVQNCCFTGCKK